MSDDIIAKLDELDSIRTAADVTRIDYEAKRAEILKQVQAELDDLDAEFKPLLNVSEIRIEELEEEIKQAVLKYGESVKSGRVQAVYYKGRVTWNSQQLDRYATTHPEVTQYRKEGEPSIQIRVVKK